MLGDGGDALGNHNFGDGGAAFKGAAVGPAAVGIVFGTVGFIVQNRGPAQGVVQLLQIHAVQERTGTQAGDAVGDRDAFQGGTCLEGIAPDGRQALPELHGFQLLTAGEAVTAKVTNRGRHSDGFQGGTSEEGRFPHIGESLIQLHIGKGKAILKNFAAHGLDALRENHFFQGLVVIKGIVSDPLNDVPIDFTGNGNLGFGAGVSGEFTVCAVQNGVREVPALRPGLDLHLGRGFLNESRFFLGSSRFFRNSFLLNFRCFRLRCKGRFRLHRFLR